MYCPACGVALREGARFCPTCGAPVPTGVAPGGQTWVPRPHAPQQTQVTAAPRAQASPTPAASVGTRAAHAPLILSRLSVRSEAALEVVCTLAIASLLAVLAFAPGFVVTPTWGRLASARTSLSLSGLLTLLFTGSGTQNPTMTSVSASILIAITILGAIAAWITTGLFTATGRRERPSHALAVALTTLLLIALLGTQSLWQLVCPWLCRGQPLGLEHLRLDLVDSPSFPLTAPLLSAAISVMAVEAFTRKKAMAQEGSQHPDREACAQSVLCALGLALCVTLLCGVPVLAQVDRESSLSLTGLALIIYTCASGWVPGIVGAAIVIALLMLTLTVGTMQVSRIARDEVSRAGMVVTSALTILFALSVVTYVYLANSPGTAPALLPLPFYPSIAMWVLLVTVMALPMMTPAWHCTSMGARTHTRSGDGGAQ